MTLVGDAVTSQGLLLGLNQLSFLMALEVNDDRFSPCLLDTNVINKPNTWV